MIIGIDASRAFFKERTGIEEYSYQVIKHLIDKLKNHQVVLYVRKGQNLKLINKILPDSWKIKIIRWPYLWTQIGLSLEMLFNPVDVLFIPAHTVPLIHPNNTVVTIHGLEYEFCPQAYSFWARVYMRWAIRNSCRWAKKIIAVSNNTKKDLIKLYRVPENKIKVVYEGYNADAKFQINSKLSIQNLKPHLFFVGRLEERKNIVGIIKSFEILKEQYKLPHKLVLAGSYGYGQERIQESINNSNFRKDIVLPGYISEKDKWELFRSADVFLFPTFYEGFGLPVLEAQSAGVPVVAGNNSSIPEVANCCHSERSDSEVKESNKNQSRYFGCILDDKCSAVLVNPNNAEEIADAVYRIISDKNFRDNMIKKGYENIKRFSWEKCAEEIAKILID